MSFTIPNLLSILRMGLVPLFVISVIESRPRQALVIFVIAGITDALDGAIARIGNQSSQLGTYLDPIADKLLLASAYTMLAIPRLNPEVSIPVWVTVVVIARDVLLIVMALILYLALGISKFRPVMISKVTTSVQILTVVVVLVAQMRPGLATTALYLCYLVAALTVVSGFNYLVLGNGMVAAEEDA